MAQYPANIDLSSLNGTLKLSGEAANDLSSASVASAGDVNGDAVVIGSADLDGAVTEAEGKPAGGTKLADSGTFAFFGVDVNDNHSLTVTKSGTPHGNVPATVTADTSNLGAALGTPAVLLIADTTNGTGGSLSWTSPSILAQWNIFRPAKNGSRR